MQIFKRVIAFILAFLLVESTFSFLLEPVTFEHFLPFDEKKMEKNGQEIELAVFGDSRAIRSYKPDVFEQEMQDIIEGSINEGVNQQHIISTYYYMKDFLKHHELKYAIVNINYDYFLNTVEEPVEAKGLTFDRIKSISGMCEYVGKRFEIKEYPAILKSYRYRWQVKNIGDNLRRKLSSDYRRGIDNRQDIHYVNKGYVTWDLTYQQGNTGTPAGCQPWNTETVNTETLDIMDKMVKLCHENGVRIFFVESPVTMGRMYAIEGYDEFEQTVKERCEELDVPFYNLNLIKEDNISVNDANFSDTEHMNDDGSIRASHMLAEIIKRDIEGRDAKDLFYDSFEEMNHEWAMIGACDLFVWDTDSKEDDVPWEQLSDCNKTEGKIILQSVAYADSSITSLYCFMISHDDGRTYTVLQDYSTDNTVEISKTDLKEKTYFRVETKPDEGFDLHHCFMERSIGE